MKGTRLSDLVWNDGALGPFLLGSSAASLLELTGRDGSATEADDDGDWHWEVPVLGLSFQIVDEIVVSIAAYDSFFYRSKNLIGLSRLIALDLTGDILHSEGGWTDGATTILEMSGGVTLYLGDDIVTMVHVSNYDLVCG
jgi:hypothetical protein